MGKIQILPPELINQIAAGEVVERPASVVKEMVENAIDAGATRIEVIAGDGGRYLRVADNGCGMEKTDLEVAFYNHATSKVKQLDDLFQLHTLGFRGEALASIAAISKITCTSRTASAETGLKAIVQHSGQVTLQETGCAAGTIFEVRELFYNVPARLKFLKRPQTELSYIQETIQMLALSHPEIAFHLKVEEATVVKTSGSGELARTIEEVFALPKNETLLHFEFSDEEFGFKVWGKTSPPQLTRGSKKWIQTFVNQRAVKCPILTKAIETAYQSLMTPGKFPVTVLFLELPLDEVDVNVHPTKKEVKYQRANTVFSFVRRALDQCFSQQPPSLSTAAQPLSGFPQSVGFNPSAYTSGSEMRRPVDSGFPRPSAYASAPAPRPITTVSSVEQTRHALDLYTPITPADNAEAVLPQIPDFKIIGQMSDTYILVEKADGLLIVDQHIASERVHFERFKEQSEQSEPVIQHLMFPMGFAVSPGLTAALTENQASLEGLGFQYTFAENQVLFNSVPALYNQKVLNTALTELLSQLEETGQTRLSADDVIATAACHSAVRAGDPLNPIQMRHIVEQWLECTRPWTCPHGRPVSHTVTHREIMAFFERPSLPNQVAKAQALPF